MRKNFGAALSALLIVLCTSCGGLSEEERKLGEADKVMIDYPDSAYSIIEGIDTLRMKGSREKAIYAALRAQSRYKTARGIDNAARLRDASAFLAAEGENHYALIAEYYIACDERGRGNDMEGMLHLLNAEQLAKDLGEKLLLGQIYLEIAEIYNSVHSYANELEYARRAYEFFKTSGRENFIRYSLGNLALAYNNNQLHKEAAAAADSLLHRAHGDSLFMATALKQNGVANMCLKNYEEAANSFGGALRLFPEGFRIEDYRRMGVNYLHGGWPDSARMVMEYVIAANGSDDMGLYELYEHIGDYESAYKSLKKLDGEMDAILRGRIRESVSGLTMAYMEERQAVLKARMERERMLNLLILVGCVAVVAGIGAGWVAYRRRKLRQQHQLMADGERLALLLEKERDASNEAQKFAMDLFRDNLRMLDSIFSTYVGHEPESGEGDRNVSSRVAEVVRSFSEDSAKLKLLEDKVNQCEDGLMRDFRRDFPGKKGWIYQVELFHATGLSGRVIALLLGISPSAYYTRKSRMIKMIKDASPKRCADYLRVLG